MSSRFEGLLRQDRVVVLGALAAVAALAWGYLLHLARSGVAQGAMPAGEMPGMDMPGMMAPAVAAWTASEFLLMFGMWTVMMIGMMLPSVAPMLLIHARVARDAVRRGKAFAATGWFASGYLLSWTAFAFGATAAQWALEQAALLSPMGMETRGDGGGGMVLIAAGLYQWTPLKHACLSQCQTPLAFIQRHGGFRADPAGSLRLGSLHGLYCIGCCWALMAILFAVGVMNILWIAALAAFVLLEKVAPGGRRLSYFAGAALVAGGLVLAA